ncbi:hypothetical protein VNO80_16024 [Phaseolus coccineus]|uniref:Uncharacterized protein n=1 Tax=Phaseolus coccineus TaxID=3886 RepID=A0AAN9R3I1_PHACN
MELFLPKTRDLLLILGVSRWNVDPAPVWYDPAYTCTDSTGTLLPCWLGANPFPSIPYAERKLCNYVLRTFPGIVVPACPHRIGELFGTPLPLFFLKRLCSGSNLRSGRAPPSITLGGGIIPFSSPTWEVRLRRRLIQGLARGDEKEFLSLEVNPTKLHLYA